MDINDYIRLNFCDLPLNLQNRIIKSGIEINEFLQNYNKFKLTEKQKDKIRKSKNLDIDALLKYLNKENIKLVPYYNEYYPEELKHIYAPPILLYVKGNIDLLKERKFAIVGSRKATSYGKMIAKEFAEKLASNGEIIVSGLAMGIDSLAHRGGLKYKRTISVMATGIDLTYPSYNKKLREEIEENGLIITEYFPGTKPEPFRFPIRNRIISGLSWGILVVEATIKSGSLITAKYAIEQGKEVYSIPGDINKRSSSGTNYLIKNGMAYMVTDVNDIIPDLIYSKKEVKLNEKEKSIFDLIMEGNNNFDTLIEKSELDFGELSSILFQLELKGLIIKVSNNIYRGVSNGK